MPRKFEPWKQDRLRGIKLAAYSVASAVAAGGFAMKGFHGTALVLCALALVFGGAGASRFKSASNRAFGKVFEEEFVERGMAALSRNGFQALNNVVVRGIGDIDLVVYRRGIAIPVEVKSFRKWNQFFVFKGEREKKALVQSERQRRALKAKCGILWVPQGRPTLLQRLFGAGSGNVSVVFGEELALVRSIRRQMDDSAPSS